MIPCTTRFDSTRAMRNMAAALLDHARGRDLPDELVLRGSGLSPATVRTGDFCASAAQYLAMLRNVLSTPGMTDTPFLLAERLLPGHLGAASHALLQAPDLGSALATLTRRASALCPLARPRLRHEGDLAVLYFTDSQGAGTLRGALAEMHMTAVVALTRWLGGQRLPWRFCFNRTRPRHTAQHQVHLGPELRFDCHLDALLIDRAWLDVPWPRGNANAAAISERDAAVSDRALPSLLDTLYDSLLARVRQRPTLDATAQEFGVSCATLKRHLAHHGTHFQAELDQVRAHVALHLFHSRRYDNDAVADYFGFHDAANFRRSCKRWTGLTPLSLREHLGPQHA